MTLLLSLILLMVGMIFPEQISKICGSSDTILPMASEYLFYYTAFSVPFLFSNCLSIFVRNDGAPTLSFVGMCAGAVANIFLDWLFIFPMGMGLKGAAIASGLGQLLAFCILISHFIRKKGQLKICRYKPSAVLVKKICKRGIPECVSQLNTPVTAFCYNWVLAGTLGDIGVSTFSILSFIYSLANAILSGISQGLQPLWGNAFGKKDGKELQACLKSGKKMNLISAVVIFGLLLVFDTQIIQLFNSDAVLVETAKAALPIFAVSFIFMSYNLIYTAYFYSTKQTGKANIIALSRGIVIKALCIFLTPALLGDSFVWWAAVIAEFITFIICLILQKRDIGISV